MKFSKAKKDKIRKSNEKRISRQFGKSYSLSGWYDENNCFWDPEDTAKFRGKCYILASCNDEFAIFKMVAEVDSERVKLSAKQLLKEKTTFEHPSTWERHSEIKISDTGKITHVEVAKHEIGGSKLRRMIKVH